MKTDSDNKPLCSACTAKAKFEVNEDYACGRHLAYICKMHCDLGNLGADVKLVEKE